MCTKGLSCNRIIMYYLIPVIHKVGCKTVCKPLMSWLIELYFTISPFNVVSDTFHVFVP